MRISQQQQQQLSVDEAIASIISGSALAVRSRRQGSHQRSKPALQSSILLSTLRSACLSALLAFMTFANVHAEDTTSWKSFRNGPQNLGVTEATLPDELELLWEITTPDGVTSTPVISNGKTYVGSLSGDLHSIDLKTGKVEWSYRTKESANPKEFAPGFNAPLSMNDKLVFGGDDFGIFHAVNIETGKKAWTFETEGEIVGGSIVIKDNVIFGSHDGHLYCLNTHTGEKVWAADTGGPVNGTPCVIGNLTFTTGCDKPILRVFNLETGEEAGEVPLDALLLASAAAKDDKLYFGSDGGIAFALDWQKKSLDWEFSVPNRKQQMQSSPAITETAIILGSRDKTLYALDRKTGELKWSFQTRGRVDSSPVVCGKRIFFGSSDKNIYALNLEGQEVWKYYAKQSITGSPAIVDGYMVIGTDSSNGRILCFGKK